MILQELGVGNSRVRSAYHHAVPATFLGALQCADRSRGIHGMQFRPPAFASGLCMTCCWLPPTMLILHCRLLLIGRHGCLWQHGDFWQRSSITQSKQGKRGSQAFGAAVESDRLAPGCKLTHLTTLMQDVEVPSVPNDGISSLSFSPTANLMVATSWNNQVRPRCCRRCSRSRSRPCSAAAAMRAPARTGPPARHRSPRARRRCAGMCSPTGSPSPRRQSRWTSRCCAALGPATARRFS